jgi:hypothetical protein
MAYFARLDENNTVLEVLAVSDDDVRNLPFPESESVGISYLTNMFPNTTWAQTSDINSFRVRYAGPEFTFVSTHGEYGGFAPPKAAEYFIWNEETCSWIPPVPYPNDNVAYYWNFNEIKWTPVTQRPPQTHTIG